LLSPLESVCTVNAGREWSDARRIDLCRSAVGIFFHMLSSLPSVSESYDMPLIIVPLSLIALFGGMVVRA
jgi:hypothetical protein